MNHYEILLDEAFETGLNVKEKSLKFNDGRVKGNKIAIRRDIETTMQKADVLAEEMGHFHTSVGDIMDLTDMYNRKQERQARLWAYNKRIGLRGLIDAFENGCRNRHEIAEFLQVGEEFLQEAINCYSQKFGVSTILDEYIIMFSPNLMVGKIIGL